MPITPTAKKSLGQHWLHDPVSLQAMCDAAELNAHDTVLEIGPGLGTLTAYLVHRAGQVVAVEYDADLARDLPATVPAPNLQIYTDDILRFDLATLPPDYKVVANIPYYLTSNLIRVLSEATNRPRIAVLLVQQEVAERVTATPGKLSILGVTAQYYWQTGVGPVVPAELFTPPPKVDSQILLLQRRDEPLWSDVDETALFRLVKAGFSARRKKLRSSLSGGLRLSKEAVEANLRRAGIDPGLRAQALSLDDWYRLYRSFAQSA